MANGTNERETVCEWYKEGGEETEDERMAFHHSLWRSGWLVLLCQCWAAEKLVIDGWLVCRVMFILSLICIFVCICRAVGFCKQGSVPISIWWIWLSDKMDSLVTGTSSRHSVPMTDGLMLTHSPIRDEILLHLDLWRRVQRAYAAKSVIMLRTHSV